MATFDLGRVTPLYKGDYSASASYELNDVVLYNGNLYWHVQSTATVGILPTDTTVWKLAFADEGVRAEIRGYADNAQASADSASASKSTAAQLASQASVSASQAALSAQTAQTAETGATASAQTASTKASEATASAQSAATNAQTATDKATLATQKASAAADSAAIASEAKTAAITNAQLSVTKADEARSSATQAAASATSAQEYDESAQQSAVNAQTSATAAQGYSNVAAQSAESITASATQIAQNTSDIADINGRLGSYINGINKTYTVENAGANKFEALLLKGVSYTFTNNTSAKCTLRFYNSDNTNVLVSSNVPSGASATYVVSSDNAVSFGGWFDATGTVGLESNFSSLYDDRVKGFYDFSSYFAWEVGSIDQSGSNYNDITNCIRTPNSKRVYLKDDCEVVSINPNIKTVYGFKYGIDETFVERIGTSGNKHISITGGYYYRIVFIADSGTVISSENITDYINDGYICGKSLFDVISREYLNGLFGVYDYTSSAVWEIGSIYSVNGLDYDENVRAIRTKKIRIAHGAVALSNNPNIKTVYCFKYNVTGNYIERVGISNGKEVKIPGGYDYRFVYIADPNTVITSETISNYSTGAVICGETLAELLKENDDSEGYIIGPDLIRRNIYAGRIGTGTLKYVQSFLIYNGKYYSTDGNHIAVQDSDFNVEQDVALFVGHGNSFQLGYKYPNFGYISGWDDNNVYVVNLDMLTIDSTITLPTTGYTSCAVDDVNGLIYIFQRETRPNTEANYNLIVYDYVNEVTKASYVLSIPFGAMQACDIYQDKIVVLNGLGTNKLPNGYRVYNTIGQILASYNFDEFSAIEPEGVFINRSSGEIYISFATARIYKIYC